MRTEQTTVLEDALESIPPTLAFAAVLASALEIGGRSIRPVPSRLDADPGRSPTGESDPEAVASVGTPADPRQLPVRIAGDRP